MLVSFILNDDYFIPKTTTGSVKHLEFGINTVPSSESSLAKLPTAVQFEQVPAIFNSSMIPGAQTYHALQVMGVDKDHRVSQGIYDAIHLAGIPAKNLGHYTALVKNLGVDADLFTKTASSFTVNVRVNQSKSATYGSRLEGTPSLLVAGKYMIISNEYVPGFDAVLAVADFLIAQELAK